MAWRFVAGLSGLWLVALAGCTPTVNLYHSAEGGAIAGQRQPPPGLDQPYPNLASVPAAPSALSPAQQAMLHAKLSGAMPDVQGPAPGALAGLELPDAAPAPPPVGIEPALPVAEVTAPVGPAAAPVAATPDSAPVSLAFESGSAVLNPVAATALTGLAAAPHGGGAFLVAGFGEGNDAVALALGLARAQRLADGLTTSGVPPAEIKLLAAAAGSGGFVQIVY